MITALKRLPILLVALAAPAYAQQQTPAAVFTRYCVTCHNPATKVAGLVINPADVSKTIGSIGLTRFAGAPQPSVHALSAHFRFSTR